MRLLTPERGCREDSALTGWKHRPGARRADALRCPAVLSVLRHVARVRQRREGPEQKEKLVVFP